MCNDASPAKECHGGGNAERSLYRHAPLTNLVFECKIKGREVDIQF